ncbi:MAG TPA: biotin--[acetyl-CoA-carboxylase] ligase [Polyangiaceae bacterium]|nr:biotin--[acetyl-CoA-carboxylase] ligase [Polyangiaceae bacterium]
MSFDVARFEADRAARGLSLGSPVSWLETTESTNDDALKAAKAGARHGALCGAETQSRGRGRRGSEWHSEPGAGLWFSVLLRPQLTAEVAPALSLCAGLAVREAVASRSAAQVAVKWPNDVLAGGRKIAGILIESQVIGQQLRGVVVGIGLNVEQRAFPSELVGVATSLALLEARDRAREPLLVDVLAGLEARVARLEAAGVSSISEEVRQHDALLGKRLRIDEREGIGAGIDDTGHLLLRTDAGLVEAISSGHVQLLG